MTVFTKRAVDIFAPTDAGGNARQIVNGEVQAWGAEVERIIDVAVSGGDLLIYDSLADLNADLAHDANTGAILIGESIDDDGLYMKVGASGAGSWMKVGNVPGQGFVKATNAGAGTANAIQATTPVAVNETQLILLPILAENTSSPVTVAFNGGAVLTVKTVSGIDVAAGGLPAGSVMLGVVQSSDFRLLSDQASASIVAAAEAAQAAAEAAAAQAAALAENGYIVSSGAVGDAVTNDTAAIASMEATINGRGVNLLGLTYLVDAVPTGNDYYNGAFKVGSDFYELDRNPKGSQFDGMCIKSFAVARDVYRGFGHLLHKDGSPRLHFVLRESLGHGRENGVKIRHTWTDDGFNTHTALKTIFTQANADTRNSAAGTMANGRLGLVFKRQDFTNYPMEPNPYLDGLFLYSDDDGDSWSSSNITFTAATFDAFGDIQPWPASRGGHDTLGYIFYSYSTDHGICAYTTIDNGANWVEHLDCITPTGGFPSLSETSVAWVPGTDQGMSITRTNSNFAICTTTDGINFTAPVALPIPGLANPPTIEYVAGEFVISTFSRRGSKEVIDEAANALVSCRGNAEAVYASYAAGTAAGFSEWKIDTMLPFWPTGYMSKATIYNRPYYAFTVGEDTAGGSTSRTAYPALMSPDKPVTIDADDVFNGVPRPNLVPTGGFQNWPLGTSFTTGASRIAVMAGFTVCRGDASAGAVVTRMVGDKAQYAMRVQRSNGNTSVSPIYLNSTFTGADSFVMRERFITVRFRARHGSAFTGASNFLFVRARSTTSAESRVVNADGTFTTGDTTVTSSSTGVTLTTAWADYELLLGPFDDDINQARLEFYWVPVGTAAGNDWFEMEMLKVEHGKASTPFEWRPLSEIRAWADRFVQAFTIRGVVGAFWYPFSTTLHRAADNADVVCSAGTVSQAKDAGFILTTAGSDTTVTVKVNGNL